MRVEGNYLAMLELAPEFAGHVRAATREERFVGTAVPNYFRRPYGPGWALVGDAGYNKDFITPRASTTPSATPNCAPPRCTRRSLWTFLPMRHPRTFDRLVTNDFAQPLNGEVLMSPRQGMEQPDRPSADDLRERVLAGMPVAERRMSLAGVSTAVLEGGDGPPIVLLHSSEEFAAYGCG